MFYRSDEFQFSVDGKFVSEYQFSHLVLFHFLLSVEIHLPSSSKCCHRFGMGGAQQ